MDESGRNSGNQADFTPGCNVFARVFVLVIAVLVGGNLHVGSARAAGESLPSDLSAQVDGIVSSALGATQQQPVHAQETANAIVEQALTLAHTATAEAHAAAAAAPSRPRASTAARRIPAVAADSSELPVAERTPPAAARHAAREEEGTTCPECTGSRFPRQAPDRSSASLRYDGSSDTFTPSPARPSPAAPAQASPRPDLGARLRRNRRDFPGRCRRDRMRPHPARPAARTRRCRCYSRRSWASSQFSLCTSCLVCFRYWPSGSRGASFSLPGIRADALLRPYGACRSATARRRTRAVLRQRVAPTTKEKG